jgi:hypothetical protein
MQYSITFTQQEVGILMAALGELPMKISYSVAEKIAKEQKRQDEEKAIPIDDLQTGPLDPSVPVI